MIIRRHHVKLLVAGFFISLSAVAGGLLFTKQSFAESVSGTVTWAPQQSASHLATTCSSYRWHGDIKLSISAYRNNDGSGGATVTPTSKTTSSYKVSLYKVGAYTGGSGAYGQWKTYHYGYIGNGQVGWIYDGLKTVGCKFTVSV